MACMQSGNVESERIRKSIDTYDMWDRCSAKMEMDSIERAREILSEYPNEVFSHFYSNN